MIHGSHHRSTRHRGSRLTNVVPDTFNLLVGPISVDRGKIWEGEACARARAKTAVLVNPSIVPKGLGLAGEDRYMSRHVPPNVVPWTVGPWCQQDPWWKEW